MLGKGGGRLFAIYGFRPFGSTTEILTAEAERVATGLNLSGATRYNDLYGDVISCYMS